MPRVLPVALAVGLLISTSCQRSDPEPKTADAPAPIARAAVQLTVLVVDDKALAGAIKLLRGEWTERSGGELAVAETSLAELLAAEKVTADIVVYPSRHVGTLVTRRWLRPMRDSVLQHTDFAQGDLLPVIRNHTMRYGGDVYGLSLGEPPLMFARNLSRDAEPPGSWRELDGQVESRPTALHEFLARAISNYPSAARSEALFDPATMASRLNSSPFLRALTEMAASGAGDASLTISWPGQSREEQADGDPVAREFLPLPKAQQVYSQLLGRWEANPDDQPIALMGFGGRTLSVTRASRNTASAFKLAAWLGSGKTASELSQRSPATLWFRRSQVSRAKDWLPEGFGSDETVAAVTQVLSGGNVFLLPRIPGIDEYLDVITEGVDQADPGAASAEEALQQAAEQCEAVTDRYGRNEQIAAYRQHLGFDDSAE